MWTSRCGTSPEASSAIAGLDVSLHFRAHPLLSRTVWEFRHPLVPHRKNGSLAA